MNGYWVAMSGYQVAMSSIQVIKTVVESRRTVMELLLAVVESIRALIGLFLTLLLHEKLFGVFVQVRRGWRREVEIFKAVWIIWL